MRGLSPYPGTWTTLAPKSDAVNASPSVLKIFKTLKTGRACDAAPGTIKVEHAHMFVATADEWLEIVELQAAGKKRMAARDFLNGFKSVEEFEVK